jgi:hypothetical protein
MDDIESGLWVSWKHAVSLNITSTDLVRAMIKLLIAEYWRSYNKGDMNMLDGMTRLLRIFKTVNDLINYRLLTEPKLSRRLFTPHLLDQHQCIWPRRSRIVGLPPNNYGD